MKLLIGRKWIIGLAAVVFLAACESGEGRKAKYLEEGWSHFENKDYEKARISFKNVLQIDPKDIDGALGFAQVQEKLLDWRAAAGRYQSVLAAEPENITANLRYGKILFAAQSYETAMEKADLVLSLDPDNGDALTLKAAVMVRSDQVEEALPIALKAYESAVDKGETAIVVSNIYKTTGQSGKAIEFINKALADDPSLMVLQLLLVGLYEDEKLLDKAEEKLKELIAANPEELSLKVRFSQFLERQGKFKASEKVMTDLIKEQPDLVEAKISHARIIRARGETERADELLAGYIKAFPDQHDLYMERGQNLLDLQKFDEAKAVYEKLSSSDDLPPSELLNAKSRIALILIRTKKVEEAEKIIAEVLEESPNHTEALRLRGGIALAKGEATNAIVDLRTVLRADPSDISIMKLLARSYFLNSQPELAIEQLQIVAKLIPEDTETNLILAKHAGINGKIDEAIEFYKKVYDEQEDNEKVVLELVRLLMGDKRWDEAEVLINDYIAKNEADPKGYHFLGLLSQRQEKFQDSIAYFDKALERKPFAVEPMKAKVESLAALKKNQEAITWLLSLKEQNDTHAMVHNLLAELYYADGGFDKSLAALDDAIRVKPDWWIPYSTKSSILRRQDKLAETEQILLEGIAQSKNKARLRVKLAALLEGKQDTNGMIGQYEKLVEENSDDLRLANNLAMLLVTYRTDQASLDRALELTEKTIATENPIFLDTAGWVRYKRGEYAEAMPIIRRAAEQMPDSPIIRYHLAETYYSIEDWKNAQRHISAALESEKDFGHGEEALALKKAVDEKLKANQG